MKNLVKKISKIKFNLRFPNKKKILVYDNNSVNILSKIIDKNFNILMTRYEEISIPILVFSLFINIFDTIKFRDIYFNYLKTFILISNPHIIITFIDNDTKFYQLKKKFKKKKFIAIQNGYRFYKQDLIQKIESSSIKFICDEYYCFGENIKAYLKKKIHGKVINIGSIKNNFCKKLKVKKTGICFISSFGISNNKFEKKILKYLFNFCKVKKIKLYILARTSDNKEKKFFGNILSKNKFIYFEKNNNFCSSYNLIDKVELSISLNATLGYENLSRGNKTFFLNVNDRNLECKSFLQFGYPNLFPKKGYFWSNNLIKNEFLKKIDFIYKQTNVEWRLNTSKIVNKVMTYEPGNLALHNRLKKYL